MTTSTETTAGPAADPASGARPKRADARQDAPGSGPRPKRADARQNIAALVQAAKVVFTESGVDAPVRAIAARAGVGVGTLYRHFPLRSDLISAVFRHEIDECVAAAGELEAAHPPGEALDLWTMRYTQFVATKRGLAAALHSGDPAYEPLRDYFATHLAPTLDRLLRAATQSGEVHQHVEATDFLGAVANLCDGTGAERMVGLLLLGLRDQGTPRTTRT